MGGFLQRLTGAGLDRVFAGIKMAGRLLSFSPSRVSSSTNMNWLRPASLRSMMAATVTLGFQRSCMGRDYRLGRRLIVGRIAPGRRSHLL